ncbi:MAG: hypothetical protein KC431_12190, partial [Myxococcales bacterium]|nr:hypothetical protein [Myxococcales bacterium]
MWRCGALHCGRHDDPDDVCPESRGPWFCGLVDPHCGGHRERGHRCDPERALARQCNDPALHGDRPSDDSGNGHSRLAATGVARGDADGTQTTTVDLRSRACACPRCNPCAPPFPEGDAPTDIILEHVYVIFHSYWRTREVNNGIVHPLEFLSDSAKVITVHCRHTSYRWPFSHGFDHFTRHYRFRTNHANVDVAFFWGDHRVEYDDTRQVFNVKLRLTAHSGPSDGQYVKLILQCRPNGSGEWRDLCCRPRALLFRPLSRLRGIAPYFGRPQWTAANVGFFIDPSDSWLIVRMTGRQREQLRSWLEQPLTPYSSLGIINREIAMVTALALLWYLDDSYGENVAEFFGDPIGFIQRSFRGQVESRAELLTEEQQTSVARTTYGRVLRRVDARRRQQWIYARRAGAGFVRRAEVLMQIAEWITGGARVAVEGIRIAQFIESVLRTDTLYTSEDMPFFVTFGLDRTTGAPNGIVAVNLVPDSTLSWLWHVGTSAVANQFLFWESANAYYLSLLNADRRVRQAFMAHATSETDGKTSCYMCHGDRNIDRRCSVCEQSYHWSCMEWEFGAADCPRC